LRFQKLLNRIKSSDIAVNVKCEVVNVQVQRFSLRYFSTVNHQSPIKGFTTPEKGRTHPFFPLASPMIKTDDRIHT